ncbi:MAG: aminopeptidase [Deltaproteobacteria bacterium]|nr:aminopeptidase [Deltaproteobacteria bacterium]
MARGGTRWTRAGCAGLALGLAGCKALYVVDSARFQAELLARRRPVEDAFWRADLSEHDRASLALAADVKAWGAEIGLSATENYETLAVGWEREVQVVTACPPLSLEPESEWYPIVGRLSYRGYFRDGVRERAEARLRARGLDLYTRPAGAWSTLGWFRDPLTPGMLRWGRFDLAETVLHELAHATVWVPGDLTFNESFAGFVGEEGAFRYIAERYGPESAELRAARAEFADLGQWRAVQEALTVDLGRLYADPALDDEAKLKAKAALFAGLHGRVDAAGFHDPRRFHHAVDRGTWNNARMVQFRTYNDRRPIFEELLRSAGGDLLCFMRRVQALTKGTRDPWQAVQAGAAVPAECAAG